MNQPVNYRTVTVSRCMFGSNSKQRESKYSTSFKFELVDFTKISSTILSPHKQYTTMMMSLLLLFPLLAHCSVVQFDETDPIASHPEMKRLVNDIVRRRGIDTFSGFWTGDDRQQILAIHNKVRSELGLCFSSKPRASIFIYCIYIYNSCVCV